MKILSKLSSSFRPSESKKDYRVDPHFYNLENASAEVRLAELEKLGRLRSSSLGEVAKISDEQEDPSLRPNEEFFYIDIGETKGDLIVSPYLLKGKEAPSRARRKVKTDTILTAVSGVSTGTENHTNAIVPSEYNGAIASTGFEVIESVKLDPYYLLAVFELNLTKRQFYRRRRGCAIPAVNRRDLTNIRIPIFSKEKMLEIGNKLKCSIESRIEAQKRKRAIDEIFAKYLPALPKESKLSMEINKKEAEKLRRMDPRMFAPFIKYVFNEIKKKPHFYLKDESECIFFRGKTPAEKDYVDEGTVVIKVGSINEDGSLSLKTKKSCIPQSVARKDYKDFFVTKNDVIFVATGKGSIGKVTIFTGDDNECIISGEMLALRHSRNQFLPFITGGFFLSNIGKRVLDTIAIGPTGQTHLYPKDLRNVPIPDIENHDKEKAVDEFSHWYRSQQEFKIFHRQVMSELEKLFSIEGGLQCYLRNK